MAAEPYHRAGFAEALLEMQGVNRLRIREAEMLLGEGSRMIDETGRGALAGGRKVLVAQVTRVTHTFEAVIVSCKIGRGVQASMLNRSLLEDALDVHWVAANLDEAAEQAERHDRLVALGEHKVRTGFGQTERALSEHEEAELGGLIREFGGRKRAFKESWTGAKFATRYALVLQRWSEEPDAKARLDFLYEVVQRQNNLLLHSTPTGYRQTIQSRPDGGATLNRAGPDNRWREALGHGAGAYYLAVRVLAEEFGFDRDPAADHFNRTTCLMKSIDAIAGIHDLPEGAACPCGSGWAVEDCHLS